MIKWYVLFTVMLACTWFTRCVIVEHSRHHEFQVRVFQESRICDLEVRLQDMKNTMEKQHAMEVQMMNCIFDKCRKDA